MALRSSVAAGDLTGLEEETMSLKSLVYKREYTYGEGDGGAGLEDAILAVDAQIQALSNQAALDTARVSAAAGGRVFPARWMDMRGCLPLRCCPP